MSPEQLAVEIAKHLPTKPGEMTIEQAQYWRGVAWTLTNTQLATFIHVVNTFNHPLLKILREVGLEMERNEANVQ